MENVSQERSEGQEFNLPLAPHAQVCSGHGAKVIVFYEGPACPVCLLTDDLDDTRHKLLRAESQVENLEREAS